MKPFSFTNGMKNLMASRAAANAIAFILKFPSYNLKSEKNIYLRIMGRTSKLIEKIITGKSDSNIKFNELCGLLLKLGFKVRIKGSHHIYFKEGLNEIINIQEINGHAKPYQVKQIREIIINNNLEIYGDDES